MEKAINAAILSPLFGIKFEKVEDSLESWYRKLCCDTIEIHNVSIGDKRFEIICDEEALLKSGNKWISAINKDKYSGVRLVGTIAITGAADEEGDLTSLSDEDFRIILGNIVPSIGIVDAFQRVPTMQLLFSW